MCFVPESCFLLLQSFSSGDLTSNKSNFGKQSMASDEMQDFLLINSIHLELSLKNAWNIKKVILYFRENDLF